ncbi:MAG: ABC transporter permease [Clostridia bacterium]|nr:ABC transporter permease [Clostridia bacterium]
MHNKVKRITSGIKDKIRENSFLYSELVKRDFKKKYKRTYLGMVWSVLSPVLTLVIMRIVFSGFFGSEIAHYTTFIFCGNIIFNFFTDSTNGSMGSLMENSAIFSKINVPKSLFIISRVTSSLINFALTFCVFIVLCLVDGVSFHLGFFSLIIPVACLIVFNLGMSLFLSTMFIFFRDIQYLWNIFTMLLMYASAIFYDPSQLGDIGELFFINPVYVYIKYFRVIVIEGSFPTLTHNLFAIGYALLALVVGTLVYKKTNHKFIYYV